MSKVIGIDLGKNSCSVAALDERGAVALRRRMRPGSIVEFAAKYAPDKKKRDKLERDLEAAVSEYLRKAKSRVMKEAKRMR